ncbi:formate/nitrite transporter family protein [Defluviitalea phaphyphila]|uniref:formate/nitrite transporter family protein n=1 Tax=Defluviitalea phaphyphila TaxID=1473580 RepID=UPI000731D956|nr:formate/nitrite transporter family protein [Defluviitalea phaphyphila]
MYFEEIMAVMKTAKAKVEFLKNNLLGYFIASVLAGVFVGFGILLIFTIGGLLNGQPYSKIVMGISFGIALSLVIIAGAELFTGNNFVMAVGAMGKKVSWKDVIKLWIVCYIGNWIGSIILALLFLGSGLNRGNVGEFIASAAATKMGIDIIPLFIRGILCNILVCVAVWSGFRCKSDSGKLIMISLCLFAFITTGFEHSVANMTLLTIALISPFEAAVSLGGYFYNIIIVTLGNMIGGIVCLAIPYFLMSKKKEV